jgi:hypothetical protein
MHIHGNPVNLPAYGVESAQAVQKSAAEAQAAQVRKQLLSSTFDSDGMSDFAYQPVGSDQGQRRQQQRGQPEARAVIKGVRIEEEVVAERRISVWA